MCHEMIFLATTQRIWDDNIYIYIYNICHGTWQGKKQTSASPDKTNIAKFSITAGTRIQ